MLFLKKKSHNLPVKGHCLFNLNRSWERDQKTIDLQFKQDIKLLQKEVKKIENRERATLVTYLITAYILARYIEMKVGGMVENSLEKSVYQNC